MSKYTISLLLGLLGLGSIMLSHGALARDSVDETKKANADGFVSINVVRGELRIEGWAKNEVRVSGKLDEKTKEFIFDVNGDQTVITVKIPRNNFSWGCCNEGSDLRIRVPEGSRLEIGVVSAEVSVTNILGGLDIGGVSGDLTIEQVRERIRIRNVSGQIELTDAKGRIRVKSVSGDIEVDNAHGPAQYHSISGSIILKDVSEELNLETVSGDIEVIDGVISSARGHTVSGDIDLEVTMLDRADIDFDTVSGSVRLRLGGDLDARYDMETASGSIRNRITDDKPSHSKYVRDEKLRFIIGDGDGEVIINSHSGDIVISRQ